MFGRKDGVGKHSAASQVDQSSAQGAGKHSAPPQKRIGKVVAIVCGALVSAVAVVYLVGVAIFANVLFLPATSVNGENVSLRPMAEVAAEHTESAAGYELNVSGQGLRFAVPSDSVNLAIDGTAYVADAVAQTSAWSWPVLVFDSRDLTVGESASYDVAKMGRLVRSAVESANEDATPPVNAEVAFVGETGRYEVVGGTPGTELDVDAVIKVVAKALDELSATVRIGEDQLVYPEVKADDERLNAKAESLNRYVGATQVLTVAGGEVHVIDGNQIIQWIDVGEDESVSVNAEAIVAWAKGELSERLDSVGSTRTYTRADGKQVQVGGGTYGWSIDGADLAAQVAANIESGTAATVEIPMLQSAAVWNPGGVDWGARYVDIDLSEQYVRMYDDGGGLMWESSCVSGKTSDGHGTPTGVYSMNGYRASGNVELRGKIDPATNEPEYISYVTYWMPFIDNAVALHDASWRGSFGGSIYQYNGSHGCVNLPTDAAASLFNIAHVGDVVVVHW